MVRAKFTVSKITTYSYGGKEITLNAIYDQTIPEDQKFCKATPSGTMTMLIDNPVAIDYLELGKSFYVDFTKVEG